MSAQQAAAQGWVGLGRVQQCGRPGYWAPAAAVISCWLVSAVLGMVWWVGAMGVCADG